jgi:hypothetical protein
MQRSAFQSAELHAQELDRVRKVAEEYAEKSLLLYQKNSESKMQAELERLRSELSSSTEKESQCATNKLKGKIFLDINLKMTILVRIGVYLSF